MTATFGAVSLPEVWAPDQDDDFAHTRFYTLVRARFLLAPQEIAVCYHLLRGLTATKELAQAMHLREPTIKNYLRNVCDVLGTHSREHVVRTLWREYRRARAATRPGGEPCSTG